MVDICFCIEQSSLGTRLLVSTMFALSEHGPVCQTIIQQREGYAKAVFPGSTILENEPEGKSAEEIRQL